MHSYLRFQETVSRAAPGCVANSPCKEQGGCASCTILVRQEFPYGTTIDRYRLATNDGTGWKEHLLNEAANESVFYNYIVAPDVTGANGVSNLGVKCRFKSWNTHHGLDVRVDLFYKLPPTIFLMSPPAYVVGPGFDNYSGISPLPLGSSIVSASIWTINRHTYAIGADIGGWRATGYRLLQIPGPHEGESQLAPIVDLSFGNPRYPIQMQWEAEIKYPEGFDYMKHYHASQWGESE